MTDASMIRPFYRLAETLVAAPIAIGFPKRVVLFDRLINNPRFEHLWADQGLRWVRSKINGFLIPCDMKVFSGRLAYFFRRWYEIDTQSIILSLLHEGDTFVDIGGNVGMASLTAARAVGDRGRILAFEPNPDVHAIFREAIARNGIETIDLRNAAMGGEPGRLELFIPDENHGEASFGKPSTERAGKAVEVEVVDGRTLADLDTIQLVKIDVEGFEEHVLRAIGPAMEKHRPFVITEMVGGHLARCGSSVEAIVALMSANGYAGMRYECEKVGLYKRRAVLKPYPEANFPVESNVLWVPREKIGDPRLRALEPVPH